MSDVFWAAFGGAAAAGVFTLIAVLFSEWFRRYLDRPCVRLIVDLSTYYDSEQQPSRQVIFLRIDNPHSKTVTITEVGFSPDKQQSWSIVPDSQSVSLPFELSTGQVFTAPFETSDLFKYIDPGHQLVELRYAWCRLASGNNYYRAVGRTVLEELQEQFDTIYRAKHTNSQTNLSTPTFKRIKFLR